MFRTQTEGSARPLRSAIVVAACVASATLVVLGPGPAQAAPVCPDEFHCTETFVHTGSLQNWVAPENVTTVTVSLAGSQGGTSRSGVAGGLGARVVANVAVVPNQSYPIVVGGRGQDVGGSFASQVGGYGGGGSATDCFNTADTAAGGGGASTFGDRGTGNYLVAAGGGGGGGGAYGSNGGRGGGGGNSGADGGRGGVGEKDAAGGYGGSSGTTGGDGAKDYNGMNGSGKDGTAGQGGDGASGQTCSDYHPGGGGGGGGGFEGGGGGGDGKGGYLDVFIQYRGGGGGGGGGGSSYTAPGATATSTSDGVTVGSGTVVISYVKRSAQTISFTSAPPTDANPGGRYQPEASASSGESVQFSASGDCTYNVAPNFYTVLFTGVGTCTVTATEPGNELYFPAQPQVQTFSIGLAEQDIDFSTGGGSPARYVGEKYEPFAIAESRQDVRYSVTGKCTIAGGVVQFTGTGECTLTASVDGTEYYKPAQKSLTYTVVPGSQPITFTSPRPTPKVGDTYTPTATGGPTAGPVTISVEPNGPCTMTNGIVAFTGVGQCIIVAELEATPDYAPGRELLYLYVAPADEPLGFTSSPPENPAVGSSYTPTVTGGSGDAPVTFTATGACTLSTDGVVTFTGVGVCTITADQVGIPQQTQTITVGTVGTTPPPANPGTGSSGGPLFGSS